MEQDYWEEEENEILEKIYTLSDKFLNGNKKCSVGVGEGCFDIDYLDVKNHYESISLFSYEYGRESDKGTPRPLRYRTFTGNKVVCVCETNVNSDEEAYKILEEVYKNRVALIRASI
jgi:hypothetical protein